MFSGFEYTTIIPDQQYKCSLPFLKTGAHLFHVRWHLHGRYPSFSVIPWKCNPVAWRLNALLVGRVDIFVAQYPCKRKNAILNIKLR